MSRLGMAEACIRSTCFIQVSAHHVIHHAFNVIHHAFKTWFLKNFELSIVQDEKEQSPCVAKATCPLERAVPMCITHTACDDGFNARDKAVETGGSEAKTQGPWKSLPSANDL